MGGVRSENTVAKVSSFLVLSPDAGPLVIRPDSGDPPTVVVKVLEILGEHAVLLWDGRKEKEKEGKGRRGDREEVGKER